MVEIKDEWFGEIAWAGDFTEADFDQTDIVSGSGGRRRGDQIHFVSAGSIVDRLHFIRVDNNYVVSNSLPCLLSVVDATLDPIYPRYYEDLRSINFGFEYCRRHFACSKGQVEFVYFDNLVWNGNDLVRRPKPTPRSSFSDFDDYYSYLVTTMGEVANNICSPDRRFSYTMLSTVSSGYDSATVAAIAKTAGCQKLMTIDQSRAGDSDSGAEIGKYLGLDVHVANRDAWRDQKLAELPFIAGGPGGGGSVFFKSAEEQLGNTVLFTGIGGGLIWDDATPMDDGSYPPIGFSDASLTEYRLSVGFIHCPLPLWGMRTADDIFRITASEEMLPWCVPGKYNRPVARRIVETAGVPRQAFGMKKKAAAFMLHQPLSAKEGLSPSSAEDFNSWLRETRLEWLRRGRIPPSHALTALVDRSLYLFLAVLRRLPRFIPKSGLRDYLVKKTTALGHLARRPPGSVRNYTFPWAVSRLQQNYDASRSSYPSDIN